MPNSLKKSTTIEKNNINAKTDLIKSTAIEECNGEWDRWNPMEEAYNNKDFNSFLDGPGANLSDDLQLGALASNKINKIDYGECRLCLKNVPNMTNTGIKNLCNTYGEVVDICDTKTSKSTKIATFKSLKDMVDFCEKFKSNPISTLLGIKVEIANKRKQKVYKEFFGQVQNVPKEDKVLINTTNRRFFPPPLSNQPRFERLPDECFVTITQYQQSKLKVIDTQMEFFVENDMHYGERVHKNFIHGKNGCLYFAGRSYYKASKDIIEELERLSIACEKEEYVSEEEFYEIPHSISSIKDLNHVRCTYCGTLSLYECEHCHAFYCSYECQKSDWSMHKMNCVSFTPLDLKLEKPENDVKSIISPYKINIKELKRSKYQLKYLKSIKAACLSMSTFPKNGSQIIITSICKTNVFFIRSAEKNDDAEYLRVLNYVHSSSLNSKYLKEIPKRGDIVIAIFKDSGVYNRALVLNPINKDEIVIIYIDYGNVDIKPLSQLKNAPKNVFNFKCFTFSVNLLNIENFEPTIQLRDYLNHLIEEREIQLKIMYNEEEMKLGKPQNVEIINKKNNELLNMKILQLKQTKMPTDDEVTYNTDIIHKLLECGKNIKVVITDTSFISTGVISCIFYKNVLLLQKFNDLIKDYAENYRKHNQGNYAPREKEICIAYYNNEQWNRAECLEVAGDGFPFLGFIDYGNMGLVNIKDIIQFPKDFTYFPCYTALCEIDGLPSTEEITQKAVDRLHVLLPLNSELIIEEVKESQCGNYNIIYVPKIISTLKTENLI